MSQAEGNLELQLRLGSAELELGAQVLPDMFQPELPLDNMIYPNWLTNNNINRLPQIPPSIFNPTPHYRHHALSPELLSDQGWFLHPDSWEIKRTLIRAPADPRSRFRVFVKTAKSWLHDWATTGHNIFIHHNLYHHSRGGLPPCLEDAYLTLTAYLSKTEQTQDMILQILENRATALLSQQPLPTELGILSNPILSTRAHLARTQALLIYTLLRVSSGCPRQLAQAEDSLPVLFTWAHQMRNSAITESPFLYIPPTQSFDTILSPQTLLSHTPPGPSPTQIIEQSTLWQAFITSESLRRTWMLISATSNIYSRHKDRRPNPRCLGFMSFTMRRGLWSATNAWQWGQIATQKQPSDGRIWRESPREIVSVDLSEDGRGSPVFLESIGVVEKVMAETTPDEVDDFTNEIFSIALSGEKIDRWVGGGVSP